MVYNYYYKNEYKFPSLGDCESTQLTLKIILSVSVQKENFVNVLHPLVQ